MNKKEEWRDIENYSTYEISNLGRIRSKYDKKLITVRDCKKDKCLKAKMINDKWVRTEAHVARLLFNTFVRGIDRSCILKYKDGDYHNLSFNNMYIEDITWTNVDRSKRILCVETGFTYASINMARKDLHCGWETINKALKDPNFTVNGKHFKYA